MPYRRLLRRFVGVMVSKVLLWFEKYENIRKFLSYGIAFLFILFTLIMLLPPAEHIYMYFAGITTKSELLKFIGWGMSGLIATLGVIGLLQRATALDKQNEMTAEGHIHERFKAATEHLGSKNVSVRIAAFNEFYHIADIEPDLRKTIFDILCAHLRKTTKDKNYEKIIAKAKVIKPTEEVRNLLNILFKLNSKDTFIFDSKATILKEVNLQGANLHKANLKETKLQEANLQNARLQKANLKEASLQETNLKEAKLQNANLQGASLQGADLQGTDLQGADLQGAKINQNTITTMPDDWKDMVIQDEDGKTGVLLVDDKDNIIERI